MQERGLCGVQAVSPDGRLLATGGRKGSLHLWQLQDNPDAGPARSHSQSSIMVEDAEVSILCRPACKSALPSIPPQCPPSCVSVTTRLSHPCMPSTGLCYMSHEPGDCLLIAGPSN